MAGGSAAGGTCILQAARKWLRLRGICPAGDRVGPCAGRELPLSLLPLGAGRAEGAGLWPGADGALHCRRTGQRPCGRLYAGREEAEGIWLSDQRFARKFGFETVDTAGEYELLALRFDGAEPPRFAPGAKRQTISEDGLVVYFSNQCPFIPQRVEKLRACCAERGIPADFRHVDSLEAAKALPCVFNNWAVFWNGRLATVNQIDGAGLEKIIGRA